MKKLIAVTLAFVFLFSMAVIPAYAESATASTSPTMENNISVDSTNSFGGLLSQTINKEMEKQLENNGFNVFSVEYNNGEALVELEALQDCTLFVGIYSEDSTKLITSQNKNVTKDDTTVALNFDTVTMPAYFTIQAYLINTDDLKPLCKVYSSNMYTKEMQEFLAKTTDDFEEEQVLQLDGDKTNNFAIYNDTVEIITENSEMTVTADEENGVYTVTNPTDEVKTLQVGDIFSYTYNNGDVLIVKIATVSTDNNGTITYTEGKLELEDVFDYVKIDAEAPTNSATVDTSPLDENIVYHGCIENPSTYSFVDSEATSSFSHSYEFYNYDLAKAESSGGSVQATISGSLGLELTNSLKVYIALDTSVIEIKFDYKLSLAIELSGSVKGCKVLLGKFSTIPVPGIIVSLEPSFVVECSGSISFSGSVSGSVGFSLDIKTGIKNLTKTPKIESELKMEVTVFIGLSFEPSIKILSDKVAEASLEAVVGAEVTASMSYKLTTDEEQHGCSDCIEGEIYGKVALNFGVKLLNSEKLEFKLNLAEVKLKTTDFYYSFDLKQFGFTQCPNKGYKLTVNVKNKDGKALKNIKVDIGNKKVTTNTQGNATVFLPDGKYTLKIVKSNYAPISKKIKVTGKTQTIKIKLLPGNSNSGKTVLSLGFYAHSAAVTEDGSLYMWGFNRDGQLGDGKPTDNYTPIKIMDNVASVSLGAMCSAAITTDGSLYTWGNNEWFGQLGDGTTTNRGTPQKIMDNVVSVNLGANYCAAITKDGSLYTWGCNIYGQLGNGTRNDIANCKPQKIMDGVASVCLGEYHAAAIKKDGSLYVWGENAYGLGDESVTQKSATPLKIMDDVSSVSLGWHSTAVIKKTGELYTWGYNGFGQLGDGTTMSSYMPKKIMDNVVSVSLGDYHGAVVTNDGSLYTFGSNDYGQLGIGAFDYDAHPEPQKVMHNIAFVDLGYRVSGAITKDGSIYTWGQNYNGQLGIGVTLMTLNTMPIKVTIPKIATYSLRNTVTNPNEFDRLIPNFIYNYYIMETDAVANPLNAQNLKFIGQASSDENGNLTLPEYTAEIMSSEPTVVLKEFTRVSGELEYLISNNNTAIITGCTSETSVAIPDRLDNYIPTAIADMAFEGCYNLTNVTLSNSITEIAEGTFMHRENIILHGDCKNDNTYFETFAKEQGIDFSLIHNYGKSTINIAPTDQVCGNVTYTCKDCCHDETLSLPYIKFKPSLYIKDEELQIRFNLPDSIFVGSGYENIDITLNGNAIEPNEGDKYFYIASSVDYYDSVLTADIIADVCGQSFTANCCESINSIADINSDTKFNIVDLVRMKKNITSLKESDINGDDSSNSGDLILLRKLLISSLNISKQSNQ